MSVYVLVFNYVNVDSGEFNTQVLGVYESYSQAEKRMLREIDIIHKEELTNYYDLEEEDFVEGDMSWSIWEKNEYAMLHWDLIIEEQEIQTEE